MRAFKYILFLAQTQGHGTVFRLIPSQFFRADLKLIIRTSMKPKSCRNTYIAALFFAFELKIQMQNLLRKVIKDTASDWRVNGMCATEGGRVKTHL